MHQESKKPKIQDDDEEVPIIPQSLSSDPAHFVQRIDPNKLALSKPTCIGEFSLDSSRQPQLGRSRVRYFNDKALGRKLKGVNLDANIHTFVPKGTDAEGIEQILRWIMAMSEPNSSLRKTIHECDFVLWRGTLMRLCISPYDVDAYGVGVKIGCTKHKGVYFINEFDTETKRHSESSRNDYQRRMCYGGFKFEQIVTVDDFLEETNISAAAAEPVNQNNEFVGIFKSTLSSARQSDGPSPPSLRLLYGAEIDCISPVYGEFMEIKTQYKSIGQGKGFVNKALKWWIQSYLIGIKQLIIGVHENLTLSRVELFPVDSLPKLAATLCNNGNSNGTGCCWSGSVCLEFLFQFLRSIRHAVDTLPEGAILVAERQPSAREFKFCVIAPDDASGQSEHRVLSDTFRNHSWR